MQRVPLTIFYSYADEDEEFRQLLARHLSILRREGVIIEWHRHKIAPGAHQEQICNEHFAKAAIILLLISPDFFASEHHWTEMQQALERDVAGDARVIPILLRPSDWLYTPIARLQYLPRNGKPVSLWQYHDEALLEIAQGIRSTVEELLHISPQHQSLEQADSSTNSTSSHLGVLCYQYNLHTDGVITVDWSPDGTLIASGGLDGTVQVWDAATGQHLRIYRGHSRKYDFALPIPAVYTARWSPDSKRVASAGNSASIQVWDPTNGQKIVTYEGHSRVLPSIFHAVWAPDGQRIASTNMSLSLLEDAMHIWNTNDGRRLSKINLRDAFIKSSSPGGIAWSPDNTRIAGAWSKTVQIFYAGTGRRILTYDEHVGWISTVNWSPDGKYLASAEAQTIRVWDAITGITLGAYVAHERTIRDFAWSPDGRYIASASEDKTVHIWEPTTGTQLFIYRGHSHYVTGVAWSPDSTRIASGSLDKTVHVWQAGDGR
ncbi:MAG TPA: TIR domain-containing protein [Ktedonobacteraceae bacterium]|nr:TIR domain-containing protein [Ktedonobacteraceae bacterium]